MREFKVSRTPDKLEDNVLISGEFSRWGFPAAPNDAKDKPLTRYDSLGNSVIDVAAYRARDRRSARWLREVDRVIAAREPKKSARKIVVKIPRKVRAS